MNSLVPPFLKKLYQKPPPHPHHWKFERRKLPPLPKPRESPYIVGPYLKPDYLPREYITEPIKEKFIDDFDHFIYTPTKVECDEKRKVKLLLLDDVEGLGVTGQTVEVNYRFGASKLIPMRKAEYATDFAHSWYKFGPRTYKSASSAISPRTVRLLQNSTFDLPVSTSATIQPWHLSLSLRLAGCKCPVETIKPDSIENYKDEDGNNQVKCIVVINNHEQVEVKFKYVLPEHNVRTM